MKLFFIVKKHNFRSWYYYSEVTDLLCVRIIGHSIKGISLCVCVCVPRFSFRVAKFLVEQ
jgi:hypothetical protein